MNAMLKLFPIGYGLATRLPGIVWTREHLYHLTNPGTASASYCYSVWLRHLSMLDAAGIDTHPSRVLELGPGNSIGMGLAALISGADEYRGLDAFPYSRNDRNLEVFDELVALFRQRAPIPGPSDFAAVKPYLDDYGFPHHILGDDRLAVALDPARLAEIRADLAALAQRPSRRLAYIVPWETAPDLIEQAGGASLIFSQAVLEHVGDPEAVYDAAAKLLEPGACMSHQIDYKRHGTAFRWNGHWTYTDREWALVQGRRRIQINRVPHSVHREGIEKAGLEIVTERPIARPGGIRRRDLAPRFKDLSDADLGCAGAYLLARKPTAAS